MRGVVAMIIPARAGFTPSYILRDSDGVNHPRSRGVYTAHPATTPDATPSSPLARGLHYWRVARYIMSEIIPARAGFTLWLRSGISRLANHPRSRGVYTG